MPELHYGNLYTASTVSLSKRLENWTVLGRAFVKTEFGEKDAN